MRKLSKYFTGLLAAALIIGSLSSCATNPVSGKRELMLLSKDQEMQMGAESDPQIVASYGLYQDANMQQFITTKGNLMGRISHLPKMKYEFKVLDSPVVNAFALPGGFVYFTRGIMAHFNNEAEFAGVLGHEIGHITARHSAKRYSRQMLAQVGLIAGMVVSPEFGQFADVAGQGLGLLFLKYGRDDESESDRLGVEYSTKIGYDAREMAGFFQTLKRLSDQGGGGGLPNFLSTHPDPADRFQKTTELAQQWQQKYSSRKLEVGRDSYLQLIDGLVYGEDPRQGYVASNTFYHPELRFQYPVPNGWRTVNSPSQVQMAPQDGKAMLALMLASSSNLAQAEQEFIQKYSIQVSNRQSKQVNGLNARVVEGSQTNEQAQQSIQLLVYLIEHQGKVYKLIGMAAPQDFAANKGILERSMNGFAPLSDAARINVKPERIKIVTASSTTNLRSLLTQAGISNQRLEEFAILNGMQLGDQVERGVKIKVVEK